jgi:hypothetical protein
MPSSRPFVSALAATILISLSSVWLTTFFAPVTVTPQASQPSSSRHFQLSPIPPGADWTS